LREGESQVQCSSCGATVLRGDAPGGATAASARASDAGKARQLALSFSLLIIATGLALLAATRRHPAAPRTPVPTPAVTYTAPPATAVPPTPEGAIAWEANARAPVVTSINADGVEDIFGFFRIWDGRSAWIAHAGAFDGATLKPLWQSEPIDPQLVKQAGVVPVALVAGPRIVVADTSETLRVFDLASGEKQVTLKLSGPVMDLCHAPDRPSRVWAAVSGGDAMIDLETGKSDLAPRPTWCPVPAYQRTVPPRAAKRPTPEMLAASARKATEAAACGDAFINGVVSQATCRVPAPGKDEEGFSPRYELTDGTLTVALGTKGERPFAASRTKASPWVHAFLPDDTSVKPLAPAVTDLAFGRLYAVCDRVYMDARLAAIDAKTGQTIWDVPLPGSLPESEGPGRGSARALVTTAARVYVVRAGGELDVFEASSGKSIGTIGKQ
jgi:outer membrane protein assembly factor BamB